MSSKPFWQSPLKQWSVSTGLFAIAAVVAMQFAHSGAAKFDATHADQRVSRSSTLEGMLAEATTLPAPVVVAVAE